MFHNPYGDSTGLTTNELICALVGRIDAPNSLFTLLALMAEVSIELPVYRQYLMAGSLHDAAEMIEQRPEVRDWADRLGLTVGRCHAMPLKEIMALLDELEGLCLQRRDQTSEARNEQEK